MGLKTAFFSAIALASAANCQVGAWGQCGGINWTGGTSCISGYTCTYSNPYYSQCLPGTATTTSTSVATSTSTSTPTSGAHYFFGFGDSYSTTSTDFTLSGQLPSVSNPIGNPAWPGFTSCSGYNWMNHMAGTYNTSFTYLWNFAYGGAPTNSTIIIPYASKVPDFSAQIDLFVKYVGPRPSNALWTASNSVFGVWMGVNDVSNSYLNTTANEAIIINNIMVSYKTDLTRLYTLGARNFILLNVPPIYKTPQEVALPATTTANEKPSVDAYNTALATLITNFKATHSDAVVASVDTTVPFNTALNNPTAYGSPDATCYNANGVSCLWWNNYHPGQAIQKLVAQAALAAWGVGVGGFYHA